MINQELQGFIKKSKAGGQTDEQIKSALIKNGWQPSDIEEALRTISVPPKDPDVSYSKPVIQEQIIPQPQRPSKKSLLVFIGISFVIVASATGYFILSRKPSITSVPTSQSPTNPPQNQSTLDLNSAEKLDAFEGTNFDVVDQTIYIATRDQGLAVIDNNGSEIFPRLNRGTSNNDIRNLVVDKNKVPWICYGSYEPNNPKGANIYWYTAFLNDKKWAEYDITKFVDIDNRCVLAVDNNNNLFLTTGLGIYEFQNGKWNVIYSDGKYGERDNHLENVDYVAIDKSNNFYMSSFLAVRIFKDGKFVKELIQQKDTNVEAPSKIAIAPDGTIWLLLVNSVKPFGSKMVYFRDGKWSDFDGNNRGRIVDFALSKRGEMAVTYYSNNKYTLSYFDGNKWTDFTQPVVGGSRFDDADNNLLYILTTGPSIYKVKRY